MADGLLDPQAALPEFLRRRQAAYAQAPTGLLSQQAYQAAGPFPTYNPSPITLDAPLAPSPVTGGSGSSGAAGAAGAAGGLLGALGAANNLRNLLPTAGSAAAAPTLDAGIAGGDALSAILGGSSLSQLAGIGGAGQAGLLSLGSLGGLTSTGLGTAASGSLANAAAGQSLSSMLGTSGSVASQAGGMSGALAAGAAPAGEAGAAAAPAAASGSAGSSALSTALPIAGLLGGGLIGYNGIANGNEAQGALGAGIAAASGGALAGLSGLAALGPVGLIGAGIGALAANMTQTNEFGNAAFSNYWKGVESGREIGQSDPTELAQGFINLYRTNKYEFPGQAKYGRTGNEDFLYDMTQQINSAVTSGAVPKDATAGQLYESVVKPWMATMGGGTQDPKVQAVQDYMMTDLVNSFMQGKPISNAQVKNDSKFKIVSDRPVYAGGVQQTAQAVPMPAATPTPGMDTMGSIDWGQGLLGAW